MADSSDTSKMFWGICLKPGKRYAHKTKTDLDLANVVLDVQTISANAKKVTQVWMEIDKNRHLLANLWRNNPQFSIGVGLSKDQTIVFYTNGVGDVHLTGHTSTDNNDSEQTSKITVEETENIEADDTKSQKNETDPQSDEDTHSSGYDHFEKQSETFDVSEAGVKVTDSADKNETDSGERKCTKAFFEGPENVYYPPVNFWSNPYVGPSRDHRQFEMPWPPNPYGYPPNPYGQPFNQGKRTGMSTEIKATSKKFKGDFDGFDPKNISPEKSDRSRGAVKKHNK